MRRKHEERALRYAVRATFTSASEGLALELRVFFCVDRGMDAHGQFLGITQFDDFQLGV